MIKKKVLICGATGFIGRNLCEAIPGKDEFEVVGVYHNKPPFDCAGVKWIRADLTRKDDVNQCMQEVDIVIQAAASTSGVRDIVNRPHIHVTDNALMNSLLFRAAYEHQVSHVVFFSCSIMYEPDATLVKENDFSADKKMHPNYFGAGWTKVYLEKMCEFFSGIGSTRYTAIRHSNIYGPHDKFDLERSHVFGASMTKVLRCTDGKITVWGDGSEERDLLYVSDLVDFVRLAIEKQDTPFRLLNVGYGSTVSIDDLISKIIQTSGKNIMLQYDKSKPTISTRLALDCAEAKSIFGWKPKTPLIEGIRKTMDWCRSNIPTV
jgi:GDP-L-fucose synthase